MIRMFPRFPLFVFAALVVAPIAAQTAPPTSAPPAAHAVDLALTYGAQRATSTLGTSIWGHGGSLELSANILRGLGIAMLVSGSEANNLAGSNINQSTVTITFGPRYTIRRGRALVFAEGLVGEADAFNTVLPSPGGALSSSNSLATQIGGGIDFHLSHRIAVRALQADWLRTQFRNGSTNIQNSLEIGAGLVLHLK